MEISEIFSTCSQVNILQDPTIACVQNVFFFKNLVLVLEMIVLEWFW